MAIIKPFKGFRPQKGLEKQIAAKPYDVLNSEEARAEKGNNQYSFYRINKPEVDLDPTTDLYADIVYFTAKNNLDLFIKENWLQQDATENYYIYKQKMGSHEQYGLVLCASIEDYFNDVIKKHEFTRPDKENDRIKHMDTLSAHVGPVFTCYNDVPEINDIVSTEIQKMPVYDFIADDGVGHTLWVVDDAATVVNITQLFKDKVPFTYIADGHHRAASSAKVGQRRKEANPNHTGTEEYNYFLSVLFPASQLSIIDYNRVVKDLNGLSFEDFLTKVAEKFEIEKIGASIFKPTKMHEFSFYYDHNWYKLTAKPGTYNDVDPIGVLDITVLSNNLLSPILGIHDQRTDKRIDFVGGIRGLGELEKRVNSGEMKIAFANYPVSIQQLINIADTGNVMPPKTTWFEPKLRSGLIVHTF
ncbi:MAG: DUF1015 family protein [Bacteroidota bacterium]